MTKEERKEYGKKYYEKNREKINENSKKNRENNKEYYKEYNKEYKEKNKEKLKEYNKEYGEKNREKKREYDKEYREKNREKKREYSREYYKEYGEKNREKKREYNKKWRKNNKKKNIEYGREYKRKKRKNNPLYRLKISLRCSSHRAWKGTTKPATTEKLLGCSYEEFRDYIEAQLVGNMDWDNYGKIWHIDHIVPLATIENVTQIELIESLCHYSNLQPLFAEDNLSKNDKLDYEYPKIYKTNLKHNSNK
tara:strand:+ start:722 stop:1474 length:753 start_codon:yes stop_codon:yes gene_type:complete